MLRSVNEIHGYKINAQDGEMGNVEDFYFDDETAYIRYLVVSTGPWLFGKKVLLSPVALDKPDWATQTLSVNVTKEQIKNAPDIDISKPVSRQLESRLYGYYGWHPYWSFPPVPPENPHLRSAEEVEGYHIHARDGEIGHVEDFIADDELWIIRYLVVDTRNWLPGKKVVISPVWLERVNWFERKVDVDLSQEEIKGAPEYDPSAPVNRQYEERLYDFYGRPRYWI